MVAVNKPPTETETGVPPRRRKFSEKMTGFNRVVLSLFTGEIGRIWDHPAPEPAFRVPKIPRI